jgi:hypothetical protein
MPPGITNADYVVAQYDGALAYMDACIQRIFTRLEELGLAENTLVVVNAEREPQVVAALRQRMNAWIEKREGETAMRAPIFTNLNWHGSETPQGPFTSSQQAYDTLHIGDPGTAARLQSRDFAPGQTG